MRIGKEPAAFCGRLFSYIVELRQFFLTLFSQFLLIAIDVGDYELYDDDEGDGEEHASGPEDLTAEDDT